MCGYACGKWLIFLHFLSEYIWIKIGISNIACTQLCLHSAAYKLFRLIMLETVTNNPI